MTDPLVNALTQEPAGSKPLSPEQMVETLQQQGYRITLDDPARLTQQHLSIHSESWQRFEGGKTLRYAVISCTHLGSRKQQLRFLHAFYARVADLGIDTVIHAGDLVDGDGRVYPGQAYDLFLTGFDAQLDYAAEKYPVLPGVQTYMISGNHDWSFHQRGGADLVKSLCKKRPDITYLGALTGQLTIDGLRIRVTHAKGGGTYARSYRLQKHIEQFAPEMKPDVYLIGNFHSWAHIPMYRNVVGWQLGCFQAQTEHEMRLGLYPEIGGLILEVHYGTEGADRPNGFVEVSGRVVPLYVPVDADY